MNNIVCGVSARHVHLCQKHIDKLFGKNYQFSKLKDTYNPGYVSVEKVDIGFEGGMFSSRILLPATEVSQVELSMTDCKRFRVDAPLRKSFDVEGSIPCTIWSKSGRFNRIELKEGVIRPKRHIHLCPEDSKELNLKDGDYCSIEAGTVIFKDVLVRVADWYKASFHIDTDEGNAATITDKTIARVVRENE